MGILLLVVGVLMVLYKNESLKLILMIGGAFILIIGAFGIFDAMRYKNTIGIAIGVVEAVLGIALMLAPNFFQDVMMILLAVMLIVIGLTTALGSLTVGSFKAGKIISIIVGVIMLVLGVYAILNLNSTADIVMIVIGALLIVSGVMNVVEAVQLKKNY